MFFGEPKIEKRKTYAIPIAILLEIADVEISSKMHFLTNFMKTNLIESICIFIFLLTKSWFSLNNIRVTFQYKLFLLIDL